MRDVLVTLIIVGIIPFIFRRPYIGVLLWVWLGVMNPHKLAWGFAHDFPWAAIVGGVTLFSLVFSKDPKSLPLVPPVMVLIVFVLWMNVTAFFAIYPDLIFDQWNKVMKIMAFIWNEMKSQVMRSPKYSSRRVTAVLCQLLAMEISPCNRYRLAAEPFE